MRTNGLNTFLVVIVCGLAAGCEALGTNIIAAPNKTPASSREESFKAGSNGREEGSKSHEQFYADLQVKNKLIRRDERPNDNVKSSDRKHKDDKESRHDGREHKQRMRSYKKRTRKWDDIVDNVISDNKLQDGDLDKLIKAIKSRSGKKVDKDKVRDENIKNGDGKTALNDKKTSPKSSKKVGDRTRGKTNRKIKKTTNKRKKHHKYSHKRVSKFLNETELKSLRDALLVHPFKVWKFKDRFKSMADLGIHEALLHDVVENKWNTRLEHKLFKVFKGENIHMAVIGGSNTAGGGILQDEGRTDGLFFRVILDWWQKTITPITGSHLKTRQIAMGGTSSDFFQFCHRSFVQKDADLVLLEMSVNDLHELPYNTNLSLPIEQLTRQLLEYTTEPALLYINLLSGRSYYQGCSNLEDFGQRLLSNMYEITTLSWRDAVCPVIEGKYRVPLKSCSVVCKDGHHINQLGHAHISLMVINLFRDLLLDSIGHVHELSRQVFHDEIVLPKPVFITAQSKIITDPLCWTTVTPNFQKKIIANSMEVGVMENYGFDFVHDRQIGGGHCFSHEACRTDAYSGWTGHDVGASLTLSFTVPPLGHKRRIQSRSVIFATRTGLKCGVAEAWLDDDVLNRRQIQALSPYAQTLLSIVASRVKPGDHTMSVKIIHPGDISVVGVMLGPPDGPY